MITPFPELDVVLTEFTAAVRDILGDTFVGAYVQGSFALGAGDMDSDCDFVVATTTPPTGPVEAALRRLRDGIALFPIHSRDTARQAHQIGRAPSTSTFAMRKGISVRSVLGLAESTRKMPHSSWRRAGR